MIKSKKYLIITCLLPVLLLATLLPIFNSSNQTASAAESDTYYNLDVSGKLLSDIWIEGVYTQSQINAGTWSVELWRGTGAGAQDQNGYIVSVSDVVLPVQRVEDGKTYFDGQNFSAKIVIDSGYKNVIGIEKNKTGGLAWLRFAHNGNYLDNSAWEVMIFAIVGGGSPLNYTITEIIAPQKDEGHINISFSVSAYVDGDYSADSKLTVVIYYPTNYPVYDYIIIDMSLSDINHVYNPTTKEITFLHGIDIEMSIEQLEKTEALPIEAIYFILDDYNHTPPGTWTINSYIYTWTSSTSGEPWRGGPLREHYTVTVNYPQDYEDSLFYYAFLDVSSIPFYLSLLNIDANVDTIIYNSPFNIRLTFGDDSVLWLKGYADVDIRQFREFHDLGFWKVLELSMDVIEIQLSKYHYDVLSEKPITKASMTFTIHNDTYSLNTVKPSKGKVTTFVPSLEFVAKTTKQDIKETNAIGGFDNTSINFKDWLKGGVSDIRDILGITDLLNDAQFLIIILGVVAIVVLYFSNRKNKP